MNKKYKILVFLLYILLFISIFFPLISNINFSTRYKVISLLIIFINIYIINLISIKKLNNNNILKINLILMLLLYTCFIISVTLFDIFYGRRGISLIEWNSEILKNYLLHSFNIIPFGTIKLYINGLISGVLSLKHFIINIFGNILAFMPFAILLPLNFKKLNNFYKIMIIMLLFILGIEVLQFATLSGSCDIDDLILNLLGVSVSYLIYKIPIMNKLINKIFLLGSEV